MGCGRRGSSLEFRKWEKKHAKQTYGRTKILIHCEEVRDFNAILDRG